MDKIEQKKEKKFCQMCAYYKKPKCNIKNDFTARKASCKAFSRKKVKLVKEEIDIIKNEPIIKRKSDKKFKKFLRLGTG